MHPYATQNVVPKLDGVLHSRLTGVTYRTLLHEAEAEHIAERDFYLGAEVALTFDGGKRLFVSWDQHVPYDDDIVFGLLLSHEHVFPNDSVTPYDASGTPLWRGHIGCAIVGLSLYGYSQAPFVLCLTTDHGTMFLGSAYQTEFGDGDDIFVTDDIGNQRLLTLLWTNPKDVG